MSFYITNELPPKKKISSVQSNPMKHCTEYGGSASIYPIFFFNRIPIEKYGSLKYSSLSMLYPDAEPMNVWETIACWLCFYSSVTSILLCNTS